jgi:cell filamentation protein
VSDDPYVYPGTTVLRNKFDIRDTGQLDKIERRFVTARLEQGPPTGEFDLEHLRAIHRHLFQDVYDWAGELRTVEIAKGGHHFQHRCFIEIGMVNVHGRLVEADFLHGLNRANFAADAAKIIGDVNHVHPFREGNGRAQLEYLRQLGGQAGHKIDPKGLDPKLWITASRAAHDGDYDPMREQIAASFRGGRRGLSM